MRLRTTTLAAILGLAWMGAPASAQEPLFLRPVPSVGDAAAPAGFLLIPPAVFGGPAYGTSGYGYYYDEPSEGPLLRSSSSPRGPSARMQR